MGNRAIKTDAGGGIGGTEAYAYNFKSVTDVSKAMRCDNCNKTVVIKL